MAIKIIESVRITLERTPPELSADLIERGIVIAGGASLLRGLDKVISEETGLACFVADDPLTCVVRGAGILLEDQDLLDKVLSPLVKSSTRFFQASFKSISFLI